MKSRLLLGLLVLIPACTDGPTGSRAISLQVAVEGLPGGVDAAVTVAGPEGFTQALTRTQTLSELKPGTYTIRAARVSGGAHGYAPLQDSVSVELSSRNRNASTSVKYVDLASSLEVRVAGLPTGSSPAVEVVGPGGFRQTLQGSKLLPGLAEGVYLVSAGGVASTDSTFQWREVSREVTVSSAGPSVVDVAYTAVAPRTLNLSIDRAYVVQVVQTMFGSVPLIDGRQAMLRVFAKGSEANTATPRVRARLYLDGELKRTMLASAGGQGVPLTLSQASLESSWNIPVPGELIRPGLRVEVEVDPDNAVAEASEQDNTLAREPEVVVPAPFLLRFVPVHQTATGLTGDVGDPQALLSVTRKLFPIREVDVDVRAPYTSTGPALDPGNDNGSWSTLISEIDALRIAEGTPRYYYGVVEIPYRGGIIGIGQIPGKTALGYDRVPGAAETLAHELGHDWGRRHTRCGGAGGADPEYPYDQGQIGVYGFDFDKREIKAPTATDIMGYCDDIWISDYTFNAVLEHRDREAGQSASAAEPSLLVWGHVRDGRVVLEPAFQVTTRPVLPAAPGPFRLEGVDAEGRRIFSYSFAAEPIAHVDGARKFAFAIPLWGGAADRLVSLRVSGAAGTVTRQSGTRAPGTPRTLPAEPEAGAQAAAGGRVQLRWNEDAFPMVMVRDPETGEVLSFARGGSARFQAEGRELELNFSDGVRSAAQRIRVEGR